MEKEIPKYICPYCKKAAHVKLLGGVVMEGYCFNCKKELNALQIFQLIT